MKSRHKQNPIRRKVDWETAKRQLERTRQAIETLSEPDMAQQLQILRARSLSLARAAEAETSAAPIAPELELLSFTCAGERYAFESRYIERVCPVCPITPIPGTPDFVIGVVPAAGEVLSVLDLRVLLKLPIFQLADPSAIVILKNHNMEFGILAEEIIGIAHYPLHAVERGLPEFSGISETYLAGVTTNRTAILNADQLLCNPRLVIEAD